MAAIFAYIFISFVRIIKSSVMALTYLILVTNENKLDDEKKSMEILGPKVVPNNSE